MYAQPYDTTQPTEEQQGYWHDYDKVTPYLYLHQDKVWPVPGYIKVVENLLQDKTYSRQTVRKPSNKDTNKYIGEPQFVSTKPIHVGPGTAAHNRYSRKPSSNLMT